MAVKPLAAGENQSVGGGVPVGQVEPDVPRALSSIIGRDSLCADIVDALSDHPLVTLTGAAGIGKTRLALAVAEAISRPTDDSRPTVRFVDLRNAESVDEANHLLTGPDSARGDGGISVLIDGASPAVLVLDNFEHVLGAAPAVNLLLQRLPRLRILVTSRQPLSIAGEQVIRVSPLALPQAAATLEDEGQPSVELLVNRATAVDRSFRLKSHDPNAILELCRLSDGIPLAIELLATRLSHAPAHVVLAETTSAMGNGRASRLLASCLDDLDEPHRDFLDLVANFPSTFSLEIASAAWRLARVETPISGSQLIRELVRRSLIEPQFHKRDGMRYALLQTVRDALGDLDEGLHTAAVTDALAYRAISLGGRLRTRQGPTAIDDIIRDLPAFEFCATQLVNRDKYQRAAEVAAALAPVWLQIGDVDTGRGILEELATHGTEPEVCRVVALWRAALVVRFGIDSAAVDMPTTEQDLTNLVDSSARFGDQETELAALTFLTELAGRRPDRRNVAQAANRRALALSTELNDDWTRAEALFDAAVLSRWEGKPEQERTRLLESAELANRIGHRRVTLRCDLMLAHHEVESRPSAENDQLFADLNLRARALNDARSILLTELSLCVIDTRREDGKPVERLLAVFDEVERLGDLVFARVAVLGAGALCAIQGDHSGAATLFHTLDDPEAASAPMPPSYAEACIALCAASAQQLSAEALSRSTLTGRGLDIGDATTLARTRLSLHASRECTPPHGQAKAPDALTPRERDVLREMARGFSNKEIAASLGLSAKTVMHHAGSIYRKLRVRGRGEATAFALSNPDL